MEQIISLLFSCFFFYFTQQVSLSDTSVYGFVCVDLESNQSKSSALFYTKSDNSNFTKLHDEVAEIINHFTLTEFILT